MSEVVCSVKMSISSLRSANSCSGGTFCARLAQEVLLAGGPDDVVVGVAVAGVVERVEAAERLIAGLDVDLVVVPGAGGGVVAVVVAAVDVDVDAVDLVDRAGEAREVDVDEVVDLEPVGRSAIGQLLDGLQGQLGAAVARRPRSACRCRSPGISTLRSRGSEKSAIASRSGSSRSSIVVSERPLMLPAALAAAGRSR